MKRLVSGRTHPSDRTLTAIVLAVLALAAALLVAACSAVRPADHTGPALPDTVGIDTGKVQGNGDNGSRLFQGIPYAAAPVGALRWQPPAAAANWDGVRDATRPGARCPQAATGHGLLPVDLAGTATEPVAEDCLFLNVRTPASSAEDRLPVLVWIHGGSFTGGSGSAYDAKRLAAQGIVVVTVNYRLGTLGFLAHPAVDADGSGGDYGLLDQQAALRWVQRNIGAFGGDPAQVTIAGESAGGISVCGHLAAPGSAGLFRSAVLESGACDATVPATTARRSSLEYAAALGCADPGTAAACLRALPAERLVAQPVSYPITLGHIAYGNGPWLVSGGSALPENPADAIRAGRAARVPVLSGTTRDEMRMAVYLGFETQGKTIGAENYEAVLAAVGGDPAQVRREYPVGQYPSPTSGFAAAMTDAWVCDVNSQADARAAAAPAYTFEFAEAAPFPRSTSFPMGAYHTAELPYLFDVADLPVAFDARQTALANQVVSYWANFVRAGNPNGAGLPEWPRAGEGRLLSLAAAGSTVSASFAADHHCGFWERQPLPGANG
ncbi:carboxylesterase/lipase family protein [Nocardia yamanashiensis]|uniref:carboxylesterase/lipase family protein n=1 Tax=Nocardia yamanashiensis TaxID=209247 RepID=UPI000B01DA54|nr:carboxylesterase family protein [Nocardia yamanashiensis]